MRVEEILRAKGSTVETIAPAAPVADAVLRMAHRRIGCVVVSDDGDRVEGLLTERDVVRAIAYRGSDSTHLATASVMSTAVPTCRSSSDVLSVMRTMTDRRFRHMPVLDDGRLMGIVSIGDVVKQRLEELELEAMVLRDGFRSRH
jgi:CBS domain-containing protein